MDLATVATFCSNSIASGSFASCDLFRSALFLVKRHRVAKVLFIISHATAVKAHEFRILNQFFDFIQLALAHENAKVSKMIMRSVAFVIRHKAPY